MKNIIQNIEGLFLSRIFWLIIALGHGLILLERGHRLPVESIFELFFALMLASFWTCVPDWFWAKRRFKLALVISIIGAHSFGLITVISLISLIVLVLKITSAQIKWDIPQSLIFKLINFTSIYSAEYKTNLKLFYSGLSILGRAPPFSYTI